MVITLKVNGIILVDFLKNYRSIIIEPQDRVIETVGEDFVGNKRPDKKKSLAYCVKVEGLEPRHNKLITEFETPDEAQTYINKVFSKLELLNYSSGNGEPVFIDVDKKEEKK